MTTEVDKQEIALLEKEITTLEQKANAVQITNKEEYEQAGSIVVQLKDAGSKIKKAKESVTKPLNEALRNARLIFAPIEGQFANAEIILKGKILAYNREVAEEARKKEEAIAKRVEKGTMKIETAETKMDQVEKLDKTTRNESGAVQVRKIKKVRIVDEALLPREYLTPNMTAIRRDALSGKEIAGVEVYEEEVVAAGYYKDREVSVQQFRNNQ